MTLQRKPDNGSTFDTVPPIVHEVLRSPGQPLDSGTLAFFEPRFGHDFSGVRVHADARAAESAKAVNSLAYTVGHDIFFGQARYTPQTLEGQKLLAHELAHVIQQSGSPARAPARIDEDTSSLEGEAERSARVIRGDTHEAVALSQVPVRVARQRPKTLEPTAAGGASAAAPPAVDSVEISCPSMAITFHSQQGDVTYQLNSCDITPGEYDNVNVIASPNYVNFDLGEKQPEGTRFKFGYRVGPGQPNPSALLRTQKKVRIVARAERLTALTPDELLRFMGSQRGFGTASGPAKIDPKGVGKPTGKGYQTYAAIQIIDNQGKQVRVGIGAYLGGTEHGEAAAIAALRSGLPTGANLKGGTMIVAVEQIPCEGCTSALKSFAEELGLSKFEVYVPARESLTAPGTTVRPKTAATTAFRGGAQKPTVPRLVISEKLGAVLPSSAAEAGEISAEARAAARAVAADVATDFRLLRAARVLSTAVELLNLIASLQMLDEFISMAESGLAGRGFVFTKEIEQSADLQTKSRDLQTSYGQFSDSVQTTGFKLFKAGADATAAGQTASEISTLGSNLKSLNSDLGKRIAKTDRAATELRLKREAIEKILSDPKASGAIAAATFGTAQLAELLAVSQDFSVIEGNLDRASAALRSVQTLVTSDIDFLQKWWDFLFEICEKGGMCAKRTIEVPFLGPVTVQALPAPLSPQPPLVPEVPPVAAPAPAVFPPTPAPPQVRREEQKGGNP
jgi:hypothetical protein